MVYPVYIYGSSVLKEKTKPITKDYPELEKLIKDMFDTMYDAEGVGLAAPQIGKDISLFVVDASGFEEEEPELANFKKAFINPEIIEFSGEKWAFNEGCLSVPGIREDVWREETITIKYLNENFEEQTETLSGMASRIIQHEYDHLLGNVFTDRLAPLRKTLVKSKLNKMVKGNYKARYRCKQVI
ncbi:MAG: peptide deformylase [Rikenellaceae bacterium]